MEITTAEREIILETLTVVRSYSFKSKWNDNEYHVTIGTSPEGRVQSIEEYVGEGEFPAYFINHLSIAEAVKKIETNSDIVILAVV